MNKSFREQMREQQQITRGVAEAWGYTLAVGCIEPKEKQQSESSPPVVTRMRLLRLGREGEKTEKIKQVEDEIRAIQNERMFRELKDSKYNQPLLEAKSDVINLMQKMVQDYNDILEHKRKGAPNSPKAYSTRRKGGESRRKGGEERLLRLIQLQKTTLLTADLKTQIKINRQMALLYRQFNEIENNFSSISVANNKSEGADPPLTCRSIQKHRSQTLELEQLASISTINKFFSLKVSTSDENMRAIARMFRKGSEFAASADPHLLQQYRHLHAKNTHSPQKKQGELPPRYPQEGQTEGREKGKEKGDIEEPFLAKREVEEYVELENKIKSNKDAFELWKSKIYEASSHLGRPTKPQNEKRREIDVGQLRMQRREEEIEQALQRSLNIISIETPPTTHTNHTQKIPRCQKQQILAQILRRRNNKFNKLGGTKILVKYDCEEEAKWMLEGQQEKQPTRKVQSAFSHRRGRERRMEGKEGKEGEEEYWRMCRTQKMNLLLKKR